MINICRNAQLINNRITLKCALCALVIVTFLLVLPLNTQLGIPLPDLCTKQPHENRALCEENHNIVFLKVHRTGSTTIANILQRYGLFKDLTFALPDKSPDERRYNYFGGVGGTLNASAIKPSKRSSKSYNILYNHVIFNKSAFLPNFPKAEFTYVTMLRDPLRQFLSSLQFFLHDGIVYAAQHNVTAYLKDPSRFEPQNPYLSFTDNRQALDLGLSPSKVRDLESVISHIGLMEEVFDLVLITEYYDESLIILKRRMCWQLKDIIYLPKNAAYQTFNFDLSDLDKLYLKNWNMADHYIYEYFLGKFKDMLSKESEIAEETRNFRRVLSEIRSFCTRREKRNFLLIKQTKWNPTFRVTSLDCAYMRLGELEFQTKLLKQSAV